MRDNISIEFKSKIIILSFEEFDSEFDMDQLTGIDYSNLYAELITIPSIMNRVGLWKAEAENLYSLKKLELEIKKAQVATIARKSPKIVTNAKGEKVEKEKTIADVDDEVTLDQGIQVLQRNLLNRKKEAEQLDSLYWAVKSKEGKLNAIGEKMNLAPEEFEKELVSQKWNGILIKAKNKLI